jgi:phage/plasmid primase-like uncharacterized protein
MTDRDLATRFKLHRAGRSWRGDCPACGYAGAFVLDLRDGRPVGWCASCQDTAAIGRLVAGDLPGGWTPPSRKAAAQDEARAQRRRDDALRLFEGAIPAFGTPAQRYLARRGLPDLWKSAALRFRADTPHPDRCRRPAMLAIVRDPGGHPCAVHRTYITPDGSKSKVEPAKATLGPFFGGAVQIDAAAPEIVIGEGIETSASAGLLLGLPAWAAVCAGNLAKLILPESVRTVTIAADRDANGVGERAADEAASRWRAEGRRVRIALPDRVGHDFNDILQERANAA